LILGSLSALVYGGLLAYVWTRDTRIASLTAALGVIGCLLLLYALLRRADDFLPWPLVLLGIAYAVSLLVRGSGIDEGAPLVAAGMLLCSELASWSFDERRKIAAERTVVVARATALTLLVLAGLGASSLALALAAAPIGGGIVWTTVGAVAAVTAVALAARVSR
jgi:hypothetical protein